MRKKERAAIVIERLKKEYPEADCTLDYNEAWKPAIVTDTHCIRLCNRIGLVDNEKNPKKVEMALWKIIPPEEGSDFCHRLVYHGREVCTARTTPYCEKCCLADVCKSYASYMKEKKQ